MAVGLRYFYVSTLDSARKDTLDFADPETPTPVTHWLDDMRDRLDCRHRMVHLAKDAPGRQRRAPDDGHGNQGRPALHGVGDRQYRSTNRRPDPNRFSSDRKNQT